MEPDSTPHDRSAALDEELVAYLDGELDAAESRRIEELLAHDPDARQRLHGLQTAWDLLDELDRPPVDPRFTQTTLEMVAVAATKDLEHTQQLLAVRRRRRGLLAVAGIVLAAAAGFGAVAALRPDPNRRLLEDLPILENLDVYRQVGEIQFLRLLRDEQLFDEKQPGWVEGRGDYGARPPSWDGERLWPGGGRRMMPPGPPREERP